MGQILYFKLVKGSKAFFDIKNKHCFERIILLKIWDIKNKKIKRYKRIKQVLVKR